MKAKNPYTGEYIEYPLELLDLNRYEFRICHETPFSERFSEWAVYLLDTADMIYVPAGQNRCRNIYIVTWEFTSKQVQFPYGIYTIPLKHFTHQEIFN